MLKFLLIPSNNLRTISGVSSESSFRWAYSHNITLIFYQNKQIWRNIIIVKTANENPANISILR